MSRAGAVERAGFTIAVLVLLATHMLGFDQAGRPLIAGWLPLDLGYRVVWMVAAAALVVWMTARLWPDRE